MRRSTLLEFGAGLCLTLLVACSSSNDATSVAPAVCTAPGYHGARDTTTIERVDATLLDPSGAPIAHSLLQVCGVDQCFALQTNDRGKVTITPPAPLIRPAFKYGNGDDYAELAAALSPTARQDLGEITAWPLPAYADGAAFPQRGAVENGDVTLFIEGNVSFDHLTYSDDSQLVFRTVAIPLEQSKLAIDPSLGFEVVYGLAPLGTTFCPAARASLNNTLAWPPGSEVEVFIQGLEAAENWAPYGEWLKVAEASVSKDGRTIDTTSGGLPILSSIALRRK
jgi:hypothetical protein